MKNLYPIFLLLLLVTCKKKQDAAPLVPTEEVTQDLPTGVVAFTIDEVPQKNVRFVALDGSSRNHNWVMVTLPQNYSPTDQITARVKLFKDYVLRDSFGKELDASALKFNFSKVDHIWLSIYDKIGGYNVGALYIYVDPTVPMLAPSTGKNYEEVLEGQNIYLYLPIQNLGTGATITEKDSLVDRVTILIKNKQTGKITVSYGAYFLGNPNKDLFALVPAEMESGEYELTVQKQNRKVVIPDALILKNGKPIIKMLPLTSVSRDGKQSIDYQGYNLLSSHEYTMELRSDMNETIKLKLSPGNQLSITQSVPISVASGNYEAMLFIDGKVMPPFFSHNPNVFVVKKESGQPVVLTLSNQGNAVPGEVTLYKAVTTFKRSEPIIADLRDGIRTDMVMLLKNTVTNTEYELPYGGTTTQSLPFSFFNIAEQIPNGQYQVRVKKGNQVSEIYQRLITIE